ncbi:hypothetical protein INT46_005119 [Mucor plumbeus]|uniref:F-box domain-containing protein n=1 Tax=Mucor plumbeus TaxID=97098 RepID=A0A8H7RPX4_9FUNG|nr:hypothetical protein INT46_005119 [Mucor plumbeus]
MSTLNFWNNLPSEVLQFIFNHIESTSDWKETKNTFYQCELVCKGWARPARRELYKNVHLSSDEITKFASAIFSSVTTPKLGYLVKNVVFYPDLITTPDTIVPIEFPHNISQLIDIILQNSPNIERIGSSTAIAFESKFVWRHLLSAKTQHRHLKLFAFSDGWDIDNRHLYSTLAIKFKHSLAKLRLVPDQLLSSMHEKNDFLLLVKQLKEFKSLEELQLSSYYMDDPILGDLDYLINNCSQKTLKLELQDCNLISSSNDTKSLIPNRNIKKLQISNPKIDASSFYYFANKLEVLETLVLSTSIKNTTGSKTQEQLAGWWNQLINLCLPLRYYDIKIDEFNDRHYIQQIRDCTNLLIATTNRNQENKAMSMGLDSESSSEFTMCINGLETAKENYIIEMKQNNSCIRLFELYSSQRFIDTVNFDGIFKSISPYSPKIIKILSVEHMLEDDELFHNYIIRNIPPEGFQNYVAKWCNIRSWSIINGVISLINNNIKPMVHLDKMIIPDGPPIIHTIASQQAIVSELKLTNSVLHPNVFLEMSSKLAQVDTLIFKRCTIMSRSPYIIEIILPATKVNRLELSLNRTIYSGSLHHQVGNHTIVVATDTKMTATYKYLYKTGYKSYEDLFATAGSKGNFLIFVRCKQLHEFVVSGAEGNDSSLNWKQQVFQEYNQ